MADTDSKYEIITGDFNAKIETEMKEEDFKSMETFGKGEKNERCSLNLICRGTQTNHSKYTFQNKKQQQQNTNKQTPPPKKKQQKPDLDLGITRWGKKKLNRFCIE